MKRREFIPGVTAAIAGALVTPPSFAFKAESPLLPPKDEEEFWNWIRSQFRTGKIINLNNGGVSPHPLPVEEAFFNYHRISNELPAYNMWRVLEQKREEVRKKLAELAGCMPEEIATNRNATEALVTIINQLPLKKGDEVVLSTFDYPRMMNAWKVREEREGIKLRWVDPETGNPDTQTLINRYTSLFNKNTKAVLLTHMINWTGRMIPAKEIAAEAKKAGIVTIVDAAHSFAHVPFNIPDLDCDYLGVSLHKWLCAPFGNGMLYVKKENITKLHPYFPSEKEWNANIKKFEDLGTRNNAAEFAISEAVDFHNLIGSRRKYERLVYVRDYWINLVKHHPKIRIRTPLEKENSGCIALLEIEGKDAAEMDSFLLDKYQIFTVGIKHGGVNGVRITPHIYTSEKELDLLSEAILKLADS